MKTLRKLDPTYFKLLFFCFISFSLLSCRTSGHRIEHQTLSASNSFERVYHNLSYKSLAILDMDQMNELISDKIKDYQNQENRMALKEALRIILSRSNEDGMVEKIISPVRNLLEEDGIWEETIEGLIKQSIETIKNADEKPVAQVTSGIILENIISEFKPLFIKQYETGGFETKAINYIADSKVNYSKSAAKERSLHLMRNPHSPSHMAQKLIEAKEDFLLNQKNN